MWIIACWPQLRLTAAWKRRQFTPFSLVSINKWRKIWMEVQFSTAVGGWVWVERGRRDAYAAPPCTSVSPRYWWSWGAGNFTLGIKSSNKERRMVWPSLWEDWGDQRAASCSCLKQPLEPLVPLLSFNPGIRHQPPPLWDMSHPCYPQKPCKGQFLCYLSCQGWGGLIEIKEPASECKVLCEYKVNFHTVY